VSSSGWPWLLVLVVALAGLGALFTLYSAPSASNELQARVTEQATQRVPAPAELVGAVPSSDARAAPAEARPPAPRADSLRGRLVRPDGGPTGDGHVVALLAVGADGAPLDGGGRLVLTPETDGRFELALPDWAFDGPVLLVGRAPLHAPAALSLQPKRGAPHGEVGLLLSEGATLRGRVTYRGEPLVEWPIELDLRFGTPGVSGAGDEAFWLPGPRGGQFVEKTAHARTGPRGDFEFKGLAADRYDLRCSRPAPAIPDVHTEVIAIDGTTLALELGAAELAVRVLGAGGVLEGVDVLASCEAGTARFRAGPHSPTLAIPAHTEVTLRAEHPLHETLEARFESGPDGSRTDALLTLRPAVRPALRVHLPGGHDAGLARLALDLLPLASDGEERRIELGRGVGLDEYWLGVLPAEPGRYAVRLPSVEDFCSEVLELEVPEFGVAELTFSGARGGRFVVVLASPLADWSGSWRVLDHRDRQVGATIHWSHSEGTDMLMWDSASDVRTLPADTNVVPAGKYRVEVESEQHRPVSQTFEVTGGGTTKVTVALTPEDRAWHRIRLHCGGWPRSRSCSRSSG